MRETDQAIQLNRPTSRDRHPTCGQGDLGLTPEGGRHMVLRKDEVEIGNSG